jgi:cyclohexadienyl dehydratase
VGEALDLIEQRLALMEHVARWKRAHDLRIEDPVREARVLETTTEQARALGIDADAARELFALQIRLARRVQEHAFHTPDGRNASESLRDLDAELRPEIDRIGRGLLRALYLALPEFERDDFMSRYRDRARQIHAPGLTAADGDAILAALGRLRRVDAPPSGRIRAIGVLRIGTTGDYAPFSSERREGLSGADIELGIALAAALGVEPRFVRTSWPTLMQDFRADRFDVAMSGISITPERSRSPITAAARRRSSAAARSRASIRSKKSMRSRFASSSIPAVPTSSSRASA